MTRSLKEKYVDVHKQGWIPIFVNDSLDALRLAEICVENGFKAIEVTCRRPRVAEELAQIRSAFPELIILVGSTVDDDSVLLPFLRSRRPDMPSLEQLTGLGVDGFVAQLPFSQTTIKKYSNQYIMIPGVESMAEGVAALNAGAHFTKYCSCSPDRIKQINSEAAHRLFPVFYTGGASLATLRGYVSAGTALVGGGWDLMLSDIKEEMRVGFNSRKAAERLVSYRQEIQNARAELIPNYKKLAKAGPDEYLRGFSHYHPFE